MRGQAGARLRRRARGRSPGGWRSPSGAQYRVYLRGGRQRGLRAEAGGGDRAGGACSSQGLLTVAPFEQGDDEAGREGVTRRGAVDGFDVRRPGAGDLIAAEEERAVLAQGERDEARLLADRLQPVAVGDDEV